MQCLAHAYVSYYFSRAAKHYRVGFAHVLYVCFMLYTHTTCTCHIIFDFSFSFIFKRSVKLVFFICSISFDVFNYWTHSCYITWKKKKIVCHNQLGLDNLFGPLKAYLIQIRPTKSNFHSLWWIVKLPLLLCQRWSAIHGREWCVTIIA